MKSNKKIAQLFIGMNFDNHDTGIFVVPSGKEEIFSISTDRITRYKHDNLFPLPALERYIEYSELDADSVEKVIVSIPYTSCKTARLSKYLFEYNLHLRSFLNALYINDFFTKLEKLKKINKFRLLAQLLSSKKGLKLAFLRVLLKINLTSLDYIILNCLKGIFKNAEINLKYFDHEYCHATSAYYMSPYSNALVFTMDGFGDDNVYSRVYIGEGSKLKEVGSSASIKSFFDLGHDDWSGLAMCSIGGIYTYFTRLLGFGESDEGKTEALAAYGNNDNYLYDELKDIASIKDGEINIDIEKAESYLNYHRMQKALSQITKEDIAASLQIFTEEIILEYVHYYVKKYDIHNICLSGGVHANVIVNLRIYEEVSNNVYIAPAMTDEGAAQGALLGCLVENNLNIDWMKKMIMPYYGPSYSKEIVLQQINEFSDQILYTDLGDDWPKEVAKFIVDGKIGAIFHGKMEYGPRSLGNRSIVASAEDPTIRSRMNLSIKKRPAFQPFCPSMLEEEKDRLFDNAYSNKHMSIAFRLKEEFHDILPSAIHVDKTARVQFVSEEDNKNYHTLLTEVKKITGFGVILNTSFNKHGRTVVERPKDAIIDFLDTNMDYLVIEGILVNRKLPAI